MKKTAIALLVAAVLLSAACSAGKNATPSATPDTPAASDTQVVSPSQEAAQTPDAAPTQEASAQPAQAPDMTASSDAITGGVIDPAYGMHGEMNAGLPVLSIPIRIQDAPEGTACFAIFMDDPDASGWIHWMAANIKDSDIPADYSRNAPGGTVQGTNDFGTVGYGGPTPPTDHTYRIVAYALDAPLSLQDGFTKADFDSALEDQILAEYAFEGVYEK